MQRHRRRDQHRGEREQPGRPRRHRMRTPHRHRERDRPDRHQHRRVDHRPGRPGEEAVRDVHRPAIAGTEGVPERGDRVVDHPQRGQGDARAEHRADQPSRQGPGPAERDEVGEQREHGERGQQNRQDAADPFADEEPGRGDRRRLAGLRHPWPTPLNVPRLPTSFSAALNGRTRIPARTRAVVLTTSELRDGFIRRLRPEFRRGSWKIHSAPLISMQPTVQPARGNRHPAAGDTRDRAGRARHLHPPRPRLRRCGRAALERPTRPVWQAAVRQRD